jgi:hypothetical protein
MEISEQATPPELPGPVAENWLEWACSLEDDTNEIELHKLKNGFPRLDDFVRQLEIDWWHEGPAPEKTEKRKSGASVLTTNGSSSNGNHNISLKAPVVEEQPVALAFPAEMHADIDPAPVAEHAPRRHRLRRLLLPSKPLRQLSRFASPSVTIRMSIRRS